MPDARVEIVRSAGHADDDDVGILDGRRRQPAGISMSTSSLRRTEGRGRPPTDAAGVTLLPLLQLRQQREGLEWRHAIEVDRRELLAQSILSGDGAERAPLTLRIVRRAADRGPAAAGQLVALEGAQDLAGTVDDGAGRPASRATWMP